MARIDDRPDTRDPAAFDLLDQFEAEHRGLPIKRLAATGILLLVIAGGAYWWYTAQGATPPPTYSGAPVVRGDVAVGASATGPLTAGSVVPLAFKASGQITQITAELGQRVSRGQVLAELDTADLERALAIAESQLDQQLGALAKLAQGPNPEQLATAETQVHGGAANLASAQWTVAVAQAALDADARVGDRAIQNAESASEDAAALLEAATAQVDASRQLDSQAIINAERTLQDAARDVDAARAQAAAAPAADETAVNNASRTLDEARTAFLIAQQQFDTASVVDAVSISQGWLSALESLATHKLRSALTLLGIVIGVAAVLAIDVFGQMTQQAVARQFGPLGATLVSVYAQVAPPSPDQVLPGGGPVRITADSPGPKPVIRADLDEKDLQALRSLPHVSAAALHTRIPSVQAIGNGQNGQALLIGSTPEMQSILAYTLASGAFFTDRDEAARANVVVIGAAVAAQVFPGVDPVGQAVQLNNVPFTIKGVFAPQGSNGELDLDSIGVVPYSVVDRLRGNARMFVLNNSNPISSSGVLLQADDVRSVPQVESSAIQLIQQLHPPKAGELPFVASDFAQAVQSANQSTNDVRLALAGVSAIALLLGAFGLFSMMTVSVTERTREIGVRMAVGARGSDVRAQFLAEAVTLCLGGSAIGASIGLVGAEIISQRIGVGGVPPVNAVAIAAAISAAIGLLFGLYPAERAARLDPIVALRD